MIKEICNIIMFNKPEDVEFEGFSFEKTFFIKLRLDDDISSFNCVFYM